VAQLIEHGDLFRDANWIVDRRQRAEQRDPGPPHDLAQRAGQRRHRRGQDVRRVMML